METKSHHATVFSAGFITGALGVLVIGTLLLYMMNMSELVAISVLKVPSIQRALSWTLKHYLRSRSVSVEKIAQTDHLVDIWINLFFGIGVIWTAIGMRGALLEGLGDLNAQSAAKLGAFSILQRLVDGGILLALSTTIFGAVGGYMLRLIKSLTVGAQVKAYYNRLAEKQADSVHTILSSIDEQLNLLVSWTDKEAQDRRQIEV
jgi:hypothetical protein